MNEVSPTACAQVLQAAERLALAPQARLEELGLSSEQQHGRGARVSWDAFRALLAALETRGARHQELDALGLEMLHVPAFATMGRLASMLFSTRQLYWFGARWITPSLFPHLLVEQRDVDGGVELRVELPEPYAPSSEFWQLYLGAWRGFPVLLGLEPAAITYELSERSMRAVAQFPKQPSLVKRLGRAARTAVSPWAMAQVLADQQDELRERYREIWRSRESLQQLIDRIPDAVLVHRDGRIVYANPAMLTALALSTDLVGRPLLELIVASDRDLARTHLLGGGRSRTQLREIRMRRDGGGTVLFEMAPPAELYFGSSPAMLLVGRDITDRRRLEDHLMRSNRLSSLGRLAAGVAHELNNPLAYIGLNLQLLQKTIAQLPNEHSRDGARRSIEAARHGVERARTIVRDLSTFSRPEQESTESLDLRVVIDAAAAMIKSQLEQRASLVTSYQGALRVRANRSRMEQVFVNLFMNALEAFGERPKSQNVIEVRAWGGTGHETLVEVSDNGPGIARTLIDKVFDPFFTTKPVREGTGLGLSICHGIITRFGGDIGVTSDAGAGSTFRLTFPIDPIPALQTSLPSLEQPTATERPRRKILLIDDEPKLASILAELLELHHDVEVVVDGHDALGRLLGQEHFDLVLCDLMMVGLTGMELYDELRRHDPAAVTRLVFMTGGAFTQKAREFLESVSNECLEKPFTVDRILDVVEQIAAREQ